VFHVEHLNKTPQKPLEITGDFHRSMILGALARSEAQLPRTDCIQATCTLGRLHAFWRFPQLWRVLHN
jgi:hypothetical protein